MSSRSIDIAAFLDPIGDDAPCGRDLREGSSPTSNFQMVKLARSTARSAERSNVYSEDGQQADDARRKIDESWRKIIELAPKILKSESKDLEVACWYLESLVRRDGIAGLRDGFELIEGLIDRFWPSLYPMPDEYGLETRVGSLKGLNGEGGSDGALLTPIRNSIITNSGQFRAFSFWEYQSAAETSRILDDKAREKEFVRKGYTLQNIENAVRDSSSEFLTQLRDDLVEALDSFTRFNDKLYQLCGSSEAPPSSAITNLLKDCITAITFLGGNKIITETSPVDDSSNAPAESGADNNAPAAASSAAQIASRALANREQAFKQMAEIAEFFRKSEPHSPVSYLLEKAVRWGNMPLHELMQELISDETTRNRYSELTGVKGQ
ncbi:MAG TPA: type VI secretion system protein TssA [Cellvibrionaceae bacterium]